MSPDRDRSIYQRTEQDSQPPLHKVHQASSDVEANQLNLPNRPVSAAIPPESITPETPTSKSTGLPVALLEILSTDHSQSRRRASNPQSSASSQPREVQSNLTALLVGGNTSTSIHKQRGQSQLSHTPAMWPTDHAGPSGHVSKSRRRVNTSNFGANASIQGYPSDATVRAGSSRGHHQYPSHYSPLPHQYSVAPAEGSTEKFSSDTRRGKDRVERACSKCGTKNHIRKKECINCKEPKEPPKKRAKRPKTKKSAPSRSESSGQRGIDPSFPRPTQIQPGLHRGISLGVDPQHAAHDPPEDILQRILDPNSNFTLPEAPSLPGTSAENQMLQGDTRSSRHLAYYGTQNYDGGYRSFHHPWTFLLEI